MTKSFKVSISPTVLKWARESLHYSQKAVVEHFNKKSKQRFKLDLNTLNKLEVEEMRISLSLLKEFAKLYKRPIAVFFLKKPPKTKGPPKDFRTFYDWTNKELSPETMLVVRKARYIQEVAKELAEESSESYGFGLKKYHLSSNPDDLASEFRNQISLTQENQKEISSSLELFRLLRATIENFGVLVLKEPFPIEDARAFSLADKEPFVVVINSKDGETSYRPKIFSIIHEFSHLLLRQGAVCNNFSDAGRNVESFCNRFAASFLMPREFFMKEFKQITPKFELQELDYYLGELQKTFKVSKAALLLRFLELGCITSEIYHQKITEWDEKYRRRKKLKGKRFVPAIPLPQRTLSRLGTSFVTKVLGAQHEGKIHIDTAAEYLSTKATFLPKLELLLDKYGKDAV